MSEVELATILQFSLLLILHCNTKKCCAVNCVINVEVTCLLLFLCLFPYIYCSCFSNLLHRLVSNTTFIIYVINSCVLTHHFGLEINTLKISPDGEYVKIMLCIFYVSFLILQKLNPDKTRVMPIELFVSCVGDLAAIGGLVVVVTLVRSPPGPFAFCL